MGERNEREKMERLAERRAKAKLNSWVKQFKSPWIVWLRLVAIFGLMALFFTRLLVASLILMILAGVLLAVLGRFFYQKHKDRVRHKFHEFYEEQLKQLKLKE